MSTAAAIPPSSTPPARPNFIETLVQPTAVRQGSKCRTWCVPLYIYTALALFTLLANLVRGTGNLRQKLGQTFVGVIWMGLWGLLMAWLCRQCESGMAWGTLGLLLAPVLVIGLVILLLLMTGLRFKGQ